MLYWMSQLPEAPIVFYCGPNRKVLQTITNSKDKNIKNYNLNMEMGKL